MNETEVIKIRIESADKARLEQIAENEGRTFAGQCRQALREWLEKRGKNV